MTSLAVHFSSATDLWATPQDTFDALHAEFGFTLDVCATAENAKCADYFTVEQDGLAQEWRGVCWMNPPYGRTIGAWMRKAYESARGGGNRCLPCSCPHRYRVVVGLRDERRGPVYSWTTQVRRSGEQRAISLRCGGL